MTSTEDPGWWPALHGILLAPILPILFAWPNRLDRERARPRLLFLRTIHVATIALQLLLLAAFLVFIRTADPEEGGFPGWVAVLFLGSVGGTIWFFIYTRRQMDMTTCPEAAAGLFTTTYFIGLGVAGSIGIYGFVFGLEARSASLLIACVLLSEFFLWLVAPSRRNLIRATERYCIQGKNIDLTAALMETPGGDVADPPGGSR